MGKRIQLSEVQLKRIISESVRKALKEAESDFGGYGSRKEYVRSLYDRLIGGAKSMVSDILRGITHFEENYEELFTSVSALRNEAYRIDNELFLNYQRRGGAVTEYENYLFDIYTNLKSVKDAEDEKTVQAIQKRLIELCDTMTNNIIPKLEKVMENGREN